MLEKEYTCTNSLQGGIIYQIFVDRFCRVGEVEKRFGRDISKSEYQIYIDRFYQAMCRVLCSQEIMFSKDNNLYYKGLRKRLKDICSHSLTDRTFKSYPIQTLPLKQRAFAYCIKYKLYFMLKILVDLRSR